MREGERGALMIEGLIVYMITMLLLFFILALYMVLYQRWNIQTIAQETAAKVGQTIRYPNADMSTGGITARDVASTRAYRYIIDTSWMRDSANRANEYAKRRLSNTSFVLQSRAPEVTSTMKRDALGRAHIEVRIAGAYKVPLGDALVYFGFPGEITYDVTGYAQALDLSDYLSTTGFVGQMSELGGLGDLGGVVDNFLGVIDVFANLF